jgi:hypothetical protein
VRRGPGETAPRGLSGIRLLRGHPHDRDLLVTVLTRRRNDLRNTRCALHLEDALEVARKVAGSRTGGWPVTCLLGAGGLE